MPTNHTPLAMPDHGIDHGSAGGATARAGTCVVASAGPVVSPMGSAGGPTSTGSPAGITPVCHTGASSSIRGNTRIAASAAARTV